jgi:cellulose synthase/poly-beta-1,6-N-acetylglucosamine synthase-like glycosyltransferase
MGVGRNLCYRKDLFFSVGGFKAHYTLASGDDDLFINQVATRKNTAVSFSPDAQTISEPHQHWKGWFTQKRRHLTTSSRYKSRHQNLLALWPMTFGLMLVSFGLLMFFHIGMLLVGALLFVRYVVMLTILHGGSKNLGQHKDIVWLSPFLELHLFVLNVGLYFTNLVRKPQKWN